MFKIKEILVEYRKNPLGLDVSVPRFSWKAESDRQEVAQCEYQLIVKMDENIIWDSKKIHSGQSHLIEYAGSQLSPFTKYYVELHCKNNYGEEAEETAFFETGGLSSLNLKGSWISLKGEPVSSIHCFRKNIAVKSKVKKARIYASALGIYDIEINGKKVDERYFSPGWTSYHHQIQYQTYDITGLLEEKNQLDIVVAPGWFKGIFGLESAPDNYGPKMAAWLYMRLEYEDGTLEECETNETWECFNHEIQTSQFYQGELIDHNYKEESLGKAELYNYPKSVLTGENAHPVRITKRIPGAKLFKTPKGETVIDFGQNMAGFVECHVSQPKGTRIKINHGEVLDKEGNFYTENLREASAIDQLICSGKAEVFRPRFTFHGFRYILIEGNVNEISAADFIACAIHSDMPQTGEFQCSNEKVNRLQKNIEWGQRSNFVDIPSDCPQRDERLGWTGDAQVFARTASFNFDCYLFFAKWLKDLKIEQTEKHGVPYVVPNVLGQADGATGWGDAAVIIPWILYQVYGDLRILSDQYDSMKKWVDFIHGQTKKEKELWQSGFQFGDWVALDKEEGSDRVGATDVYFIASAFYAYSTSLVVRTAKLLSEAEDFEHYSKLYQKIIGDFHDEYITKNGRLVSETQTGCLLSLQFDLLQKGEKERVLQSLEENLKRHNNHLVTGFLGTPYLCQTLSENERHELAGEIFLKEGFPSWLYTVNKGATTMWERWNSINPDGSFDESGMNSFNHYAYGAIGDWMYQFLGGIRIVGPGYKKFMIKPEPIDGITWVKSSLETVYGTIKSEWKKTGNRFLLHISIPVNTTAEVFLINNDKPLLLGSGNYQFDFITGQSI
jgi:alpha-L-rhamnosidase